MTDTAIEPRQPRRFEKKRNTPINSFAAGALGHGPSQGAARRRSGFDHEIKEMSQAYLRSATMKGKLMTAHCPSDWTEAASDSGQELLLETAYSRRQFLGYSAAGAVALYKYEIASGSDPNLKAFARQTLPKIQDHLHGH